jgi:hypothetical protein
MNAFALVAAVLVSAAKPDPGQPEKDCARFASHYRALLQRQAVLDVTVARKPDDRVPPVAEHVEARTEAGQVAGELTDAVTRACRQANGSQYECVVTADSYEELTNCSLPGLPVLARDERREVPEEPAPPPTPEQRTEADRALVHQYVRSGSIDLEALGTGTAAPPPEAEPPAAAAQGE